MVTEIGAKACDICGKKAVVSTAKTCQLGHFICLKCTQRGLKLAPRKYCELCHTPLG